MMKNMNRRTRCSYCQVKLTARNLDPRMSADLCIDCFDAAGLENDHSDNGHTVKLPSCPTCYPEIDRADLYAADGVTLTRERVSGFSTAPHSHSSHAACYAINAHAATPAGRAACRRTRETEAIAGAQIAAMHGPDGCGTGSDGQPCSPAYLCPACIAATIAAAG